MKRMEKIRIATKWCIGKSMLPVTLPFSNFFAKNLP